MDSKDKRKKHKKKSRSRSSSDEARQPRRRPKPSGFSNFSDRPPEQPKSQMTTQEILDYYKQYNPNQGMTNHNKAERQLYVGNIPPGLSVPHIMELLNTSLKEIGKDRGMFQDGDPIIGAWISGDGHYAFIDFRSAEEATQGFVLQQISFHGNNLKVGRPKNATGPIPNPNQLLGGGGPSMIPGVTLNPNAKKKLPGMDGAGVLTSQNTKLMVSNFPATHTKEMIEKICQVFGKVKSIDLLKDTATGEFRGQVHVEYESEFDAKKAFAGMMGFKVGESVLFVKRLTTISAPSTSVEGEVFKSLIEDKPTTCLVLKNCVKIDEMEQREDYKELEQEVEEEMKRYGRTPKVYVPRPPMFGDPFSVAGFGKVYVRFNSEEEAEKAKHSIFKRRLNGRAIEVLYYPEEKFNKSQYD